MGFAFGSTTPWFEHAQGFMPISFIAGGATTPSIMTLILMRLHNDSQHDVTQAYFISIMIQHMTLSLSVKKVKLGKMLMLS